MYKVRDHEIGDLEIMEEMLVAEGSRVGWVYIPTFAFGPGKSSLYRG